MNKHKTMKSNILLLMAAFIWGSAFAAQRTGMQHVDPFTFNTFRCIFACATLIVVILVISAIKAITPTIKRTSQIGDSNSAEIQTPIPAEETSSMPDKKHSKKILFAGGFFCGVILFIASTFQQFGIVTTSAGKTGFITALYIVLVPIFGVILGKKVRPILWLSIALSVIGLGLLTLKNGFSVESGDLLVLACAFFFAIHILVIDYYSPKTNGVIMSLIQFAICGTLSCTCMIIFETPDFSAIAAIWFPIAYAGVMSSGVAYTLQIVAQKDADPTIACLLLSLESVFSVLSGWLILGEQLSPKELTGCAIMFVAVVLSQLPSKEQRLKGRLD